MIGVCLLALASCATNETKKQAAAVPAPTPEDPGPTVIKTLHIDTVPQGAGIWVLMGDGYHFEGYSPVDVPMTGSQNNSWMTYIKAVPTAPGQYTQQAYTWPGSASWWNWTLFMYNTSAS